MTLLKKGDLVEVISGPGSRKDKVTGLAVRGKVLQVLPATNQVVVEGYNLVTKHQRVRQTEKGQTGGRFKEEGPISASNVMYVDPKTSKPVRLGVEVDKDKKKRRVTRGRNSSKTVLD